MRKFLRHFFAFFLPALCFLILVNVMGDPAHLFSTEYNSRIVHILTKESQAVTQITNYDERQLQRDIVQQENHAHETMILGSSRSVLLDSSLFPGTSFYNHSVSGASIEDLKAIYCMHASRGMLPKALVICVDPWIFNQSHGQERWQSVEEYYLAFQNGCNVEETQYSLNWSSITQALSLSYFQEAFPSLFNGEKLQPKATRARKNALNTLHPDGSLSYGAAYRNATPEEIEKKIVHYLSVPLYSLKKDGAISQSYLSEFDTWTQQLFDQNISVTWFLSPYHPKVYEEIRKHYTMVLEIESLLLQRAKDKGVHVVGSYDPMKAGVSADQFYDAMHLKEEGVRSLFSTLPK